MSHYLVCRIQEMPNIEVRKRTEVSGMEGDKWLETVCLTNRETGETEKLSCPAVFVFIGAVPHTKWLPSGINLDSKGFVQTGQQVAGVRRLAIAKTTISFGDNSSRRFCRRRCAPGFDQARRGRSRRRINGGTVRSSISGGEPERGRGSPTNRRVISGFRVRRLDRVDHVMHGFYQGAQFPFPQLLK